MTLVRPRLPNPSRLPRRLACSGVLWALCACSDGGGSEPYDPYAPSTTSTGGSTASTSGGGDSGGDPTTTAGATTATGGGLTTGGGTTATGGSTTATGGGPTTNGDGTTATGADPTTTGAGLGDGGATTGGTTAEGTTGDAGTTSGATTGGEGIGTDDPGFQAACDSLLSDPEVNWRESALQSDQAIVTCLSRSLGRPVGFGERAQGGYDPNGQSQLTVITRGGDVSAERQLADAVADEAHHWIVFDKDDFREPTSLAMYRLHCDDAAVQSALGVSGPEACEDHERWCSEKGVSGGSCAASFFNDRLNDDDLPMRNIRIGSNTTIDGRQSQVQVLFSGFAVGSDSGGEPVETAESVIVTNLHFKGAGHTEDHGLDPDMLRVTGASHDVWIHQNSFELTGDAAFDVKVGAYDITISFNRVQDVKRASLHGSSDSREINAQITTTIHHNAFLTSDALYDAFGDTGRRVPLTRRGQSHLFNNVFYGYRKDVLSVRVGARVAFEDNLFLANPGAIGDDDLDYFAENLLDDYREGGLRVSGSYVSMASGSYQLTGSPRDLSASHGSTPNMLDAYEQASRDAIGANRMQANQGLVDYVLEHAGKGGAAPFNVGL